MSEKLNNQQKRKYKEDAVKEAIRVLDGILQPVDKIQNKAICQIITDQLYPNDKRRHVHPNTLSNKPYFKENLPVWIEEIRGTKQPQKSNNAIIKMNEQREKDLKEKLKRIKEYGNEYLKEIALGRIVCNNFTKINFVNWIYENKKEKISASLFSNTEGYKVLFKELEDKYYGVNSAPQLSNGFSIEKYGKLKIELEETETKLNNLVTSLFVSSNETGTLFLEGDGNKYKDVKLDKKALYKYLNDMENIYSSEIDAYRFIEDLVSKFSVK